MGQESRQMKMIDVALSEMEQEGHRMKKIDL
jgi:hypothetical protein